MHTTWVARVTAGICPQQWLAVTGQRPVSARVRRNWEAGTGQGSGSPSHPRVLLEEQQPHPLGSQPPPRKPGSRKLAPEGNLGYQHTLHTPPKHYQDNTPQQSALLVLCKLSSSSQPSLKVESRKDMEAMKSDGAGFLAGCGQEKQIPH